MKNEHVKAITEKLEILNEKQLETIRKEVESFAELRPASPRERIFESVKQIVYEIGDICIHNEQGIVTGIGANLIYDESKDEEVSLCYMYDEDVIELNVNNKAVLEMDAKSPILEALKVIFDDYRMDDFEQ